MLFYVWGYDSGGEGKPSCFDMHVGGLLLETPYIVPKR